MAEKTKVREHKDSRMIGQANVLNENGEPIEIGTDGYGSPIYQKKTVLRIGIVFSGIDRRFGVKSVQVDWPATQQEIEDAIIATVVKYKTQITEWQQAMDEADDLLKNLDIEVKL